jgi:hypothetical protein
MPRSPRFLEASEIPNRLSPLDGVRALQQLDRQYYSSVDDGPLREFVPSRVHRAKVFLRPTLILQIVVEGPLPSRRTRILIDSSEPKLKWLWNESHEIIHAGVPWHQDPCLVTPSKR